MVQSKWISDLSATTPVADAARRVLTLRLECVRDSLGQTIRNPGQDPEQVHQLRVATRRASAALQVFAECLPSRVHKAAHKQIRAIRREAGKARDWDVFLTRLLAAAPDLPAEDRPAIDMLVGYALAHRLPAQTGLEKSCRDYPFGFERCMAATVGAIAWRSGVRTPLAAFARPLLGRLFDALTREAASADGDYLRLHQVRIVGKRLRYTVEMFGDCFGPALRTLLYPAIAELQEVLGDVNDDFNAVQLYATLAAQAAAFLPQQGPRYQAALDRLRAEHDARLIEGVQRYGLWRERWQRPEIQVAIAEQFTISPGSWHVVHAGPTAVRPAADGADALALQAKRTA